MQIGRRTHEQVDDNWDDLLDAAPDGSAVPCLYHERDHAAAADDVLVERSDFFIRLATTRGHRRQGSMLVHRMYSWRGYATGDSADVPHGANQITLQACGPEGVFGTLSLRLDSPSGLLADELYRVEIDAHRARGAAVCELTGFAVDREYGSRAVLACLFQLIYLYARRRHHRSDMFIEINPRHVAFYEQRLEFRVAGGERTCMRVGATAVLLHLDLDRVEARLSELSDDRPAGRRSLYPFFLSRSEEEGLARRILGATSQQGMGTRDAGMTSVPTFRPPTNVRSGRGPSL